MRNNKGITLVILIIYMIVTVLVVGILSKLTIHFKRNLNDLNERTMQDSELDKLNLQMLKETKEEYNRIVESESTDTKIVFKNGNTYEYIAADKAIYQNNTIKIVENIESCNFELTTTVNNNIENTKNTEYIDENGDKAIIPAGFSVSGLEEEKKIENGLVIYLNHNYIQKLSVTATINGQLRTMEYFIDNKINWADNDEIEYAKKTFDQFVWIPVTDVKDMFMCQAKTENENTICDLKIEDDEVVCQTHKTTDETNSKKMAGKLYATSTGENFDSTLTTQTYDANSGLREPAIVTGKTDGTGEEYDGNPDNGISLKNLQTEYNSAVKKVIKSKGFWVGRYETSGMDEDNTPVLNIVAEKGTSDGINQINWYTMYKQQQNYANQEGLATSSNTSTQSTMIFGAAWDQIIKFVNCAKETTKTKDYSEVITGNVATDCYKNIYDLCGNLAEWTTEAYIGSHRVCRGRQVHQQ